MTGCPHPVTIDANPPRHYGGIACGCPQETPLEAAEKAVEKAREWLYRTSYRSGDWAKRADTLIRAVQHRDAERWRAWADTNVDPTTRAAVQAGANLIDPDVETS